jgi:hypothetical protein
LAAKPHEISEQLKTSSLFDIHMESNMI